MTAGLILVIAFVVLVAFGIPALIRRVIRRMSGSQGLREWLNAYGPGFRVPRRDEPDGGPDDPNPGSGASA